MLMWYAAHSYPEFVRTIDKLIQKNFLLCDVQEDDVDVETSDGVNIASVLRREHKLGHAKAGKKQTSAKKSKTVSKVCCNVSCKFLCTLNLPPHLPHVFIFIFYPQVKNAVSKTPDLDEPVVLPEFTVGSGKEDVAAKQRNKEHCSRLDPTSTTMVERKAS